MIYNNNNKSFQTAAARATLAGFHPPFMIDTFKNFYLHCGFNRDSVADLFDNSASTVKRWENNGAPRHAWLLIYTAAGYILDKAFKGHRVQNGIYYPNVKRTELKPAQFETWHWGHALAQNRIDVLTHEKNALSEELKTIKDEQQKEEEKELYKNVLQFKEFRK